MARRLDDGLATISSVAPPWSKGDLECEGIACTSRWSKRFMTRSGSTGDSATVAPDVRRIVVVVMALTALWAMVNGLFQPLLPVYVTSLGGSATDVGIATAASALAFI